MTKLKSKWLVYFIPIFIFFRFAGAEAPLSIQTVKVLLAQKKMAEASQLLKDHEKEWLNTAQHRAEVYRWMSVFKTDEALGYYEKAVENMESNEDSAVQLLEKALALEPYNRAISLLLMGRLIPNKESRARELIKQKLIEQPYFPIFNLYDLHLKILNQEILSGAAVTCDANIYDSQEMDYCHLLQLIAWVKQQPKASTPAKTIKTIAHSVKNPEGRYWFWQWSRQKEDLKIYLTQCQALTVKDKKEFGFIPGVCAQQKKALELLNAAEQ